MKFRILILFIISSFNTWAQCCCGEFYFRIYDTTLSCVCPSLNDTLKFQKYIPLEKTVFNCNLKLECIKTEGNAGTAPLYLYKPNYYPYALLKFDTGCNTSLKKIVVKNGRGKMILNLINIPREATILMDSIPFVDGEVTYDIEKIIRNNKLNYYEMPPESKFYLHYLIPYQLIETVPIPTHNVSFELKNDTMYYYADSLKTKIISKGPVKIHKTSVTYYHNAWDMKMNGGLKRKEKHKIVTFLKRGTWTYNFDNYLLQRKEKEKIERQIQRKIYSKWR